MLTAAELGRIAAVEKAGGDFPDFPGEQTFEDGSTYITYPGISEARIRSGKQPPYRSWVTKEDLRELDESSAAMQRQRDAQRDAANRFTFYGTAQNKKPQDAKAPNQFSMTEGNWADIGDSEFNLKRKRDADSRAEINARNDENERQKNLERQKMYDAQRPMAYLKNPYVLGGLGVGALGLGGYGLYRYLSSKKKKKPQEKEAAMTPFELGMFAAQKQAEDAGLKRKAKSDAAEYKDMTKDVPAEFKGMRNEMHSFLKETAEPKKPKAVKKMV